MVLISPRIHFLEIDDQPWFPAYLREKIQSCLSFCWNFRVPVLQSATPAELVANTLSRVLASTVKDYVFVDFCAGAGGPTPFIERHLNSQLAAIDATSDVASSTTRVNGVQSETNTAVKFVLTDLHPHLPDWMIATKKSDNLSYVARPIDAANAPEASELGCPPDKKVFRLYNLAFHHFDDPLAREILRNTLETADGFGIFELQHRTLSSILTILLMWPLMLVITPFYFWKSPSHLFFTYIIPIVPAVLVFDGIISSLRTRTAEEIQQLMKDCGMADQEGWTVQSGEEVHTWPIGHMSWVMGVKK